ncbi:sugar phosphate isomerase/epimerase family protein [Paenibacillus sp. VCA1]|uniref:sugar phosphate isomerase/epimerase family protein n=1 Tax=Paenibacillus sp. VCA1 TaxID=3039148 RepID=UPI002870E6D4|nr:sugar phosphate isomerase/epimerase family protein [Paenibacillus sp. VCA1]MDR9854877.1 sugar phosphate isomerase/epimerase family protein [Paenibacillus sp. VCA1]
MPFLSLNTWSLHRNLGPLRWTYWDEETKMQNTAIDDQPETIPLLDLPFLLHRNGFQAMELCHFNLPDTSPAYIQKLRDSIARSGIRLYALLADYGDITSPDEERREADVNWMKKWIDIASALGAERIRIIAGNADPADEDAVRLAAAQLQRLIQYASDKHVRIVTENFHALTSTAANCITLLDMCGEGLGLTTDFGNFSGEGKLAELGMTIPRSESIHAKAMTDAEGNPNEDEFKSCMDLVRSSGYEGPMTLVYDGPGDMWEGINRVKALVEPYL